ncbi:MULTISPECIES: hypothetical protein [unclassified Streptomyces]|uniref:hypothetical protein n=1 Tax=unclassified Streptomyces TaxID=2593676 RepID=UPI0037F4BEF5|nr:hypothetical protein OG282_18380 [Streptomyces sp. NBC_01014]
MALSFSDLESSITNTAFLTLDTRTLDTLDVESTGFRITYHVRTSDAPHLAAPWVSSGVAYQDLTLIHEDVFTSNLQWESQEPIRHNTLGHHEIDIAYTVIDEIEAAAFIQRVIRTEPNSPCEIEHSR